jgi:hypothetical protein
MAMVLDLSDSPTGGTLEVRTEGDAVTVARSEGDLLGELTRRVFR